MNAVNPTVVMTDMGKIGWSDPKKAGPMLDRIPMKQFAGELLIIFVISVSFPFLANKLHNHAPRRFRA